MYAEGESEQRFEFGSNWRRFLSVLNDERIAEAERSLEEKLGEGALAGADLPRRGSGSGLFSLAAMRSGADRVHSFDYDPHERGVHRRAAQRRYFPGDARWTVEGGDVLDDGFLERLGEFDVVYSWGVLHHTGDMWRALAQRRPLVAPGGLLFVAIYNDQGRRSRVWQRIKRRYNLLPRALRLPFLLAVALPRELVQLLRSLLRLDPHGLCAGLDRVPARVSWHEPMAQHRRLDRRIPIRVREADEILAFYDRRGYELTALETIEGGSGCNEFVFRKSG